MIGPQGTGDFSARGSSPVSCNRCATSDTPMAHGRKVRGARREKPRDPFKCAAFSGRVGGAEDEGDLGDRPLRRTSQTCSRATNCGPLPVLASYG